MTPEDIKRIRADHEQTQAQFGQALGMPPKSAGRSVRAYESGERPIKGVLALVLRYIDKYGFLK